MKNWNVIKKWLKINILSLSDGESEENPINLNYSSNENEIIYGTPLWLTKGNEDGSTWFLTFANYKLKEAKTKFELVVWFKENNFNIMMDLVVIILEIQKQKNKNHEQKQGNAWR